MPALPHPRLSQCGPEAPSGRVATDGFCYTAQGPTMVTQGGMARPRGWRFVRTSVFVGSVDDAAYAVPFPFNFNFLGTLYNQVTGPTEALPFDGL
jgi:hypothetical protein